MNKPAALGFFWLGIQTRPFYSVREIRRGKDKGKLEVEYRKGSGLKKVIIRQDDIERIFDDGKDG